jgi:hypothetical protein
MLRFTEVLIARIPNEMIPKDEVAALNAVSPRGRRRTVTDLDGLDRVFGEIALESVVAEAMLPTHDKGQYPIA